MADVNSHIMPGITHWQSPRYVLRAACSRRICRPLCRCHCHPQVQHIGTVSARVRGLRSPMSGHSPDAREAF